MLVKVINSSGNGRGADGVRIKKGEAYGLMFHKVDIVALSGRSVDLKKAEMVVDAGEVKKMNNKKGRVVYAKS